jgi:two-component system, LytTR family, sensor kinase
MLYDINKQVVFLKNEIEHIQNFIELQKFRLTDETEVTFNVAGELDSYLIEPLLLISFVENAFKFGADNRQKSFIAIHIGIDSGKLTFTAKNKIVNPGGKGDTEKSHGIGLSNVKRRLEILYPDEHKLELNTRDDVFNVLLEIKLKK